MVYTLTANPSLDYVIKIHQFRTGETNRSQEEKIFAGGKGLNVAVVLNNFGVPVKTFAITAGFTGEEWIRLVEEYGVSAQVVKLDEGETRINVKMKATEETEINAVGPVVPKDKIQELYQLLDQITENDWLCISGKVSKGMEPSAYADMMRYLEDKHCRIVVDATGELLRQTLPFHPYLIKPNMAELKEIGNTCIDSLEDVRQCAKRLIRMGAQNVLVSLGKDGALWVGGDGTEYLAEAPSGKVKNSVGCGDAMIAAFIYAIGNGEEIEQAFRLAISAGSASAFSENLATKDEVYAILKDVKRKEIE